MELTMTARVLTGAVLLLGAYPLVGCQVVAGVESRETDPVPEGCALPVASASEARVRFAHLAPQDGPVDVCVRASSGSYTRPLFGGRGRACPSSVDYAKVTALFGAPAGSIDVKLVPAGQACDAPGIHEARGLAAARGEATTIAFMGNAAVGLSVRAYPEAASQVVAGTSKVRVVHAIPGFGPVDVGTTNSARPPVTVQSKLILSPLEYGAATSPSTPTSLGKPDDRGYFAVPSVTLALALAPAGNAHARIALALPPSEAGRTVFAVGDPGAPYHPPRALVCSEAPTDALFAECTASDLPTLGIATFNADLWGGWSPEEGARREPLAEAVAHADADLLCVTGVMRQSDRDLIALRAKQAGTFLYSVQGATDLDTPPDDVRARDGSRPPPRTQPSCAPGSREKAQAAIDCLKTSCSTDHTGAGTLAGGSDCMARSCASAFIPLMGSTVEDQRCYLCVLATALSYETHDYARDFCMNDSRDYRVWRGQSNAMLLSRLPLQKSGTAVLPGTFAQIGVPYARVELDEGRTLDAYCAKLSLAQGAQVPYSGQWGPVGGPEGWEEEQRLQALRLVELVTAKSAGSRAVVLGGFSVSRASDGPQGRIDAVNPAALDILEGTLALAEPPGFTPRCTQCSRAENPLGSDASFWDDRVYLYGFAPAQTMEAGRLFEGLEVPLTSGAKVPLSRFFGFVARVMRPQ